MITLHGVGGVDQSADFLGKFNKAMNEYLGSDEMLEAVREYGYTESNLPGEDASTEWACANR